jgi:hypothetical protein
MWRAACSAHIDPLGIWGFLLVGLGPFQGWMSVRVVSGWCSAVCFWGGGLYLEGHALSAGDQQCVSCCWLGRGFRDGFMVGTLVVISSLLDMLGGRPTQGTTCIRHRWAVRPTISLLFLRFSAISIPTCWRRNVYPLTPISLLWLAGQHVLAVPPRKRDPSVQTCSIPAPNPVQGHHFLTRHCWSGEAGEYLIRVRQSCVCHSTHFW